MTPSQRITQTTSSRTAKQPNQALKRRARDPRLGSGCPGLSSAILKPPVLQGLNSFERWASSFPLRPEGLAEAVAIL